MSLKCVRLRRELLPSQHIDDGNNDVDDIQANVDVLNLHPITPSQKGMTVRLPLVTENYNW